MTFQGRLKRVMRLGNLRIADLGRLFGRRHSTVRGWVVDGREPDGTPADVYVLLNQLGRLEDTITAKKLNRKTNRQYRLSVIQRLSL